MHQKPRVPVCPIHLGVAEESEDFASKNMAQLLDYRVGVGGLR